MWAAPDIEGPKRRRDAPYFLTLLDAVERSPGFLSRTPLGLRYRQHAFEFPDHPLDRVPVRFVRFIGEHLPESLDVPPKDVSFDHCVTLFTVLDKSHEEGVASLRAMIG
jgi:hypothetical protein